MTQDWYEQEARKAQLEYRRMMASSAGYGPSNYVTRQDFSESLKEFKVQYKISLVKKALKFFNASYEVGEEVVRLVQSKDEANEELAVAMLFGSFKNTIKEEILKELRENK